ncbi:hypothetical protein ACHQM5_006211 [Ranunculus cassubicifolius]
MCRYEKTGVSYANDFDFAKASIPIAFTCEHTPMKLVNGSDSTWYEKTGVSYANDFDFAKASIPIAFTCEHTPMKLVNGSDSTWLKLSKYRV